MKTTDETIKKELWLFNVIVKVLRTMDTEQQIRFIRAVMIFLNIRPDKVERERK